MGLGIISITVYNLNSVQPFVFIQFGVDIKPPLGLRFPTGMIPEDKAALIVSCFDSIDKIFGVQGALYPL